MIINKISEGSKITIALEGRLDTATAPELQKEVAELGNFSELTFDLKDLSYISSAGLRVLMIAYKGMSNKGGMEIINAGEDIKEIFDITGFSDIFNIK